MLEDLSREGRQLAWCCVQPSSKVEAQKTRYLEGCLGQPESVGVTALAPHTAIHTTHECQECQYSGSLSIVLVTHGSDLPAAHIPTLAC